MTEQDQPDDAQPELNDPINSISDLIARLKRFTGDDKEDQELVESIETFGWLDHPAIHDENGLVIGGTRREAAAKRARVEPPEPIVREYGTGPDADRKRIRDFLIDNAASKPFSPEDRKVIARFLKLTNYSYREIGELLKVSERQAWQDVKDTSGSSPDASVPDKRSRMTERMRQFATLLLQERAAVLRRLGVTKSKDVQTFKEIARRVNKNYSLSGKDAISEQLIRRLAKSLEKAALEQAALEQAPLPGPTKPLLLEYYPAQSVTKLAVLAGFGPAESGESGESAPQESAPHESEPDSAGAEPAEQPAAPESADDSESDYSAPPAKHPREPTQPLTSDVSAKEASVEARIAAMFMSLVDLKLELLETQAAPSPSST